jgi:Ca2+/Na+ antiporter
LAAAVGYGSVLYFSGGANFTLFAVVAALFLITGFFSFLLTRETRRQRVVALLQILAFLAFFYSVKMSAILSAFGILVVFYFLAQHGASSISENNLKFRLGLVARAYMKKIFIGFALAAIVLYLPQWNSGNVFVPQPQFQRWYDGFASVSGRFYAGLDLAASVGTFAESIVRGQLDNNSQFRSLPANQQDQLVQKGVAELMTNMSKNLGFTLTPQMPLAESFYRYLLNLFTSFKKQFGDSFLAAWAVALFVIVWSVGTLLIWAVIIATYIFFEIFSAFNIVYISGESRTKEIVQIS